MSVRAGAVALATVGLLLGAALASWAALHRPVGPVLLRLGAGHGLHLGDAAAVALTTAWLLTVLAVARRRAVPARR